MGQFIILI